MEEVSEKWQVMLQQRWRQRLQSNTDFAPKKRSRLLRSKPDLVLLQNYCFDVVQFLAWPRQAILIAIKKWHKNIPELELCYVKTQMVLHSTKRGAQRNLDNFKCVKGSFFVFWRNFWPLPKCHYLRNCSVPSLVKKWCDCRVLQILLKQIMSFLCHWFLD